MKRSILFILTAAMLLAACGTQTAVQSPPPATEASLPSATELPASATAVPTEAPTSTAAVAVTETAAELPATGSEIVYRIVPGESQIQYEVGETLLNQDNRFNVAIGITPEVNGEIRVNQAAPQSSTVGTITADISQFTSDSGRRDSALRERFLESAAFPTVTFVPTQIEGLPETYQAGQDIPLKITGDLTIRDVTKPATFDATVRADADQLSGLATATILMSDYGFGPISIAGILNSEDEVKVTLNFVARP